MKWATKLQSLSDRGTVRTIVLAIGFGLSVLLAGTLLSSRASALTLDTNGHYQWADNTTIFYMTAGSGAVGGQQFAFTNPNPGPNSRIYTYKDGCGINTIKIVNFTFTSTDSTATGISSGDTGSCGQFPTDPGSPLDIQDYANYSKQGGGAGAPPPPPPVAQLPDPYKNYTFDWQDEATILGTDALTGDTKTFTGGKQGPFVVDGSQRCAPADNLDAISSDYASGTLTYSQADSAGICRTQAEQVTLQDPQNHTIPHVAKSDRTNLVCESHGSALSGIICPILTGVADTADWLFNTIILPYLKTQPIQFGSKSVLFSIWGGFRILGNLILVVAVFAVIFSEATRGPALSAYAIKSIMSRLLVSAILINLSIYIVALLIDATNVIGEGLRNLFLEPLVANNMASIQPGNLFSAIGLGAILAGIFAIYALGSHGVMAIIQIFLLFVLLPAGLALLGVLVTLVLRQGIIVFLVIVSPIAFALYCLPNTEQYFKKWWDLLFKTLMVYPIVMVIFSVSNVMSAIFSHTGG